MIVKDKKVNELAKQWALTLLNDKIWQKKGDFIPVRLMPWSSVYRIATAFGNIYLKQMALPFAIEAKILLNLNSTFPNTSPKIFGYNEDLRCFLMLDSGTPLRDRLKVNYQENFPINALTTYASIQQESITRTDFLLAMGVPNWGLATLPSLYEKLLNKHSFLKEDGLSDEQLERLTELCPIVSGLCAQLLKFGIPDTIEHGDFHDNNLLINDHDELHINDWGDAVITHPFFSLCSFLNSTVRNHHITEESQLYWNLRDSYLATWSAFESKSRLQEALELAKKLNPIKFALSFYRVAQCPGARGLGEYKGTIAQTLIQFVNQS